MIEVWNGSEWVEGQPTQGQKYRKTNEGGGVLISYWHEEQQKPVIAVDNIQVSGANLNGDIYWVQKESPVTVTANIGLPDSQLMTMVERVVDANKAVDDFRTIATISNGVLTMNFSFPVSGNFMFRCKRLNEGLERINAGFTLSFDDVEFDVYV